MQAYRLILKERTYFAKAIATGSPTTENMTAYGRAIMNEREAMFLVALEASSTVATEGF
jgi:hypothetical protein